MNLVHGRNFASWMGAPKKVKRENTAKIFNVAYLIYSKCRYVTAVNVMLRLNLPINDVNCGLVLARDIVGDI